VGYRSPGGGGFEECFWGIWWVFLLFLRGLLGDLVMFFLVFVSVWMFR
jgi:hypothetical protein